jgi:hypothetical protein
LGCVAEWSLKFLLSFRIRPHASSCEQRERPWAAPGLRSLGSLDWFGLNWTAPVGKGDQDILSGEMRIETFLAHLFSVIIREYGVNTLVMLS